MLVDQPECLPKLWFGQRVQPSTAAVG